jgi:hypothetical protein
LSNPIPDLPAFDLYVGLKSPFPRFGDAVQDSPELVRALREEAAKWRREVRSMFGVPLESATSIPAELDNIIRQMWESYWDPTVGNLDLFTRTFGLLLTETTLDLLGGSPIFRLPTDHVNIHNSIFWPGVEAFPYHKAFKCLAEGDGESMAFFVRGVGHALEERCLLTPEMKNRLPKPPFAPVREPADAGDEESLA